MYIISWIILVTSGTQAFAHEPADGSIWASIGPYGLRGHPRNHGFNPSVLGGFGIVAEGDLDHHGGIEISAFYLNQIFSLQQNGLQIEEKGKRIYIVSGYRWWPYKDFSAGLGFFSSYSIGSGEIVRNDFVGVEPPETSAHVITAYGFDGSVQWEPWRKDRYSAVIDLRYSYSVTSRPGEDSNFYGMMVALKYYLQNPDMAPPGQ